MPRAMNQHQPRAHLDHVRRHFDQLLSTGVASRFSKDIGPMWMSSIDARTGEPVPPQPGSDTYKRVYRNIDAPHGCTLYWDQPLIAAAYRLSDLTGELRYARAAEDYTAAYLRACVSKSSGLILWGNHYFYDVGVSGPVGFLSTEPPKPIDLATDAGALHECRPLLPRWDTLWRVDPAATERAIRAMGALHVVDPATGEFNRHADRASDHAFLESGGVLAASLCWLGARLNDPSLHELAMRVARFSFEKRDPVTGLVPVSPMHDRWDMHCCTSEVGHWARSLLQCAQLSGDGRFTAMARDSLAAYLRFAWDEQASRYAGRVTLATGQRQADALDTPYAPGRWSDPWESLFPTHDYAAQLTDACLTLWQLTGNRAFEEAVRRWAMIVDRLPPGAQDRPIYAEHVGRWICVLDRAGRVLHDAAMTAQADTLQRYAMDGLYVGPMFRGHSRGQLCQSVDGVGYLLLALMGDGGA